MTRPLRAPLAAALLTLGLSLGLTGACHAGSSRFCDRHVELNAAQKDTLFRFGAVVKDTLDGSGQSVALISRSGLDLSRFGVRYSHAGVSLKASQNTPWSVRQLYYACDEQRPRIFDEGMSGFVLGTNEPTIGFVSIVLLPAGEQADELEQAALDKQQALHFLGRSYSANAYPFSDRYQNCNQWVMEVLAAAWGRLDLDPDGADSPRTQAQQWLKAQGYTPSVFDVGWRVLMWVSHAIPWLHSDDHPPEDLAAKVFRVSMPSSIEGFVHGTVPGATRFEFCHTEHQIVVRQGWEPLPDDCHAAADTDRVIALD